MARFGREQRSIKTGETIPNWIDLEGEEIVAEGVGNVIVREEDDGSWSIVRSVEGAEPEIDRGHPNKEVAARLAQAYNEGVSIVIQERTSRQIKEAEVHAGMVAKYGESDVTITGVDGNDVKVLTPAGKEFYVDYTQLGDVREAQEPLPAVAPPPGAPPPMPSPDMSGMMAGEEEEQEFLEKWKKLEEEEEGGETEEVEKYLLEGLEALEEYESELEGTSVGPPVVFVEIEPLPGERQSPLGAGRTQEAAEEKKKKTSPKDLKSLLKQIGIPVKAITDAKRVKVSDVFLMHREGLPFDAYGLEGDPIPEDLADKQLSRDEVIATLTDVYDLGGDLAASLVNRATRGYPTKVATRYGIVVTAQADYEDLGTEPELGEFEVGTTYEAPPIGIKAVGQSAEGEALYALVQAGAEITMPLPEAAFIEQLTGLLPGVAEDPEKLMQQLEYARESGVIPTVAEIKMGTSPYRKMLKQKREKKEKKEKEEKEKKKKAEEKKKEKEKEKKNAMVPIGAVARISPAIAEVMRTSGVQGIRLGKLVEILDGAELEVTAKEAPTCPKCNKKHWPFHKCPSGKEKEEKKEEKEAQVGVTAKEAPTCPKCNKKHWPFHPCPGKGKEKKEKEVEKAEGDMAKEKEGRLQRVAQEDIRYDAATDTFTISSAMGVQAGLTYDEAAAQLRMASPETEEDDIRWTLDQYKEREGAPAGPEPEEPRLGPMSLTDVGETEGMGDMPMPGEPPVLGGKVHMHFDWGEFFNDVMPQLSNREFQGAFEGILNTPQEELAMSQAEKSVSDEEMLLFAREASRRGLPHPYDILYGPGDRVAVASDPNVEGEITEYRKNDKGTSAEYLVSLPAGTEIWFVESELKPVIEAAVCPEEEKKKKKKKEEEERKKKKEKKEAATDLKPTSNPDTTTVPWAERSKKITDPENVTQKKEFQQELTQKTGQTDEERIIEAIAEDIVDTVVDDIIFSAWLGEQPREAGYDQLRNWAWEAFGDQLVAEASSRYPDEMGADPEFEGEMKRFLGNVLAWKLPRPPEGPYAMKVGALVKIKADYEPALDEVRDLRDRGVAGTILKLNDTEAVIGFEEGDLAIDQGNLEVVGDFFRAAVIRKCKPGDKDPDRPADEQEWCLYSKSEGKVLGRHPSRDKALNQEKAIKAHGIKLAQERPIGGEPGTTGAPSPRDRGKVSAPPGAPSRGRGRGVGGPPQRDRGAEVCVCPITGKEYPKERGKPCADMECPDHPGVRMIGKSKAEQIPPAPPRGRQGDIPQGKNTVFAPSQRKYACDVYSFADRLVQKVQVGEITAGEAKKELSAVAKDYGWNSAQKKYVKSRLEGKLASKSSQAEITRDACAGGVPTQLALCYKPEKEAYCLYDLDFGPVSVEGAKEKDIRGQLQAFRVPDNQIAEALKDAKKGEVRC